VALTLTGKIRVHGPVDDRCEAGGETHPDALPLPPTAPCTCDTAPGPKVGKNAMCAVHNAAQESLPVGEKGLVTPFERFPGDAEESEAQAAEDDLAAQQIAEHEHPEVRVRLGFGGPVIGEAHQNTDGTYTAEIVDPAAAALSTSLHKGDVGLSVAVGSGYEQPDPFKAEFAKLTGVGYEQPDKAPRAITQAVPMTDQETRLCATFKEIFYQYTNRSGRSTQRNLGPSEIGTPCDRRLIMRLLGAPPVNPGGDNWASFRGTQVHRGLAEMFEWADAGRGRFATEQRLNFSSLLVPKGTADLLDRTLFMVDDHKVMGQWSLDKLRTKGITPTYHVQLQVYGLGARMRGEKIDHVGLIGWPGDKPNLDDMYVKIEPYDPAVARAALKRVDDLKVWADAGIAAGASPAAVAQTASIADDCRFCPFYMPDARDLTNGGCNGRT
jgi:hypothetical protein